MTNRRELIMKIFLLVIAAAWFIWNASFRAEYIKIKYKKPKAILLPASFDKERLFQFLNEKLTYPTKKALFYDENGKIIIECKYGQHILSIDGNNLYVGRKSHHAKNIEEAECLDSYIRKLFDSNASVNPYNQYKKMNSHKKKWIIIQLAMVAVCILIFAIGADETGLDDSYSSNNISESYLTQYSSNITVGEAFDNFFADGEWSNYSEGAVEYIDYSGTCTIDGEPANVVIRFWCSETEFRVHCVFLNGEEVPQVMELSLFESIYNNTLG